MAGTTSVTFHLTELKENGVSGTQFKLTANKIISFRDINGNTNTEITYLEHDNGTVITRNVVETAPAINTLAVTTFWVITTDGDLVYINADRIVYLGEETTHRELYLKDDSEALKPFELSTPLNSIVSAAGNLGQVFLQDGTTKWISSLFLGRITRMPNPSLGFKVRYDYDNMAFTELDLVASGNGLSIGSSWI